MLSIKKCLEFLYLKIFLDMRISVKGEIKFMPILFLKNLKYFGYQLVVQGLPRNIFFPIPNKSFLEKFLYSIRCLEMNIINLILF